MNCRVGSCISLALWSTARFWVLLLRWQQETLLCLFLFFPNQAALVYVFLIIPLYLFQMCASFIRGSSMLLTLLPVFSEFHSTNHPLFYSNLACPCLVQCFCFLSHCQGDRVSVGVYENSTHCPQATLLLLHLFLSDLHQGGKHTGAISKGPAWRQRILDGSGVRGYTEEGKGERRKAAKPLD